MTNETRMPNPQRGPPLTRLTAVAVVTAAVAVSAAVTTVITAAVITTVTCAVTCAVGFDSGVACRRCPSLPSDAAPSHCQGRLRPSEIYFGGPAALSFRPSRSRSRFPVQSREPRLEWP